MEPVYPKDQSDPLEIPALPQIPNDITLVVLQCLRDLQDVNAFLTTSRSALNLRSYIWFNWAKEYGYTGVREECHQYLQSFFSKIAKIATHIAFPNSLIVLKDQKISGYRTTEKILNAPLDELVFVLNNRFAYRAPELLFLIKKAAGPFFEEILNPYYIKTELLNQAAKLGEVSEIKLLCELIEDPNLSEAEFAPIHAAAIAGQAVSIKVLKEYGAYVNAVWSKKELSITTYTFCVVEYLYTPLSLAYQSNSEEAVRALLEANADPDKEFIKSCMHARDDMLKIFLELAPNCPIDEGLECSFQNSESIPCATLLLKYWANPNKKNLNGETFLLRAVKRSDVDFTRLFCQFNANLELRDLEGKSPLFIAITETRSKTKRIEIVRILCEYGADIYALDPRGRKTMLQLASKSKKLKKILSTHT